MKEASSIDISEAGVPYGLAALSATKWFFHKQSFGISPESGLWP
jgi:hypothetical protein